MIYQLKQIYRNKTQQVMFATVLGMGATLFVDILIVVCLGTGFEADALIVGLSLPRLVDTIGREGTRLSLVSLLVDKQQQYTHAVDYYVFVSGMLNLFLSVGIGIVILSWLFAQFLVKLMGPGLAIEAVDLANFVFLWSIPLVVFALGSTVFSLVLNSHQDFIVASARNLIVSLVVIVAIGLSWRSERFVLWVAVAHTLGHLLYFVVIVLYSRNQIEFRWFWRAWPSKDTLIEFWGAIIYPTLGLGIRQGSRVAERAIASVVAPGGVAAYYFAFRLVSAIQSIVGISIATTGLPKIAQLALKECRQDFVDLLKRQAWHAIVFSFPIALGIFLWHNEIVALLYGRGSAQSDSVEQIGQILQYLSLSVVFWSLVPILTSAIYVYQRYGWVLVNIIGITVVNLLLAWWLSQFLGLSGIALSVTLSMFLSVLTLWKLVGYGMALQAVPDYGAIQIPKKDSFS